MHTTTNPHIAQACDQADQACALTLPQTDVSAAETARAGGEREAPKYWCETCEGVGHIDERLGGYHFSNPKAECPDCDGKGYWTRATLSAPPADDSQTPADFATWLLGAYKGQIIDASTMARAISEYNDECEDAPPVAAVAQPVADRDMLMTLSRLAHTADHMGEADMRNNLSSIADDLIALAGPDALECERCGLSPEAHTPSHFCDNQSFAALAASPIAPQAGQDGEEEAK